MRSCLSSECCNKNTTGWDALSGKHLLLNILEVEKSKIKVVADLVSGENVLLLHRQPAGLTLSQQKG